MSYWLIAIAWALIFCAFRLLGGSYKPLSIMHLLSLPILGVHVYIESRSVDPAPFIIPMIMLNFSYAFNCMYSQSEKSTYQLTILASMIIISFLSILDWVWWGSVIIEGSYFAIECLIIMSAIGGVYGIDRYLNRWMGGRRADINGDHSAFLCIQRADK